MINPYQAPTSELERVHEPAPMPKKTGKPERGLLAIFGTLLILTFFAALVL